VSDGDRTRDLNVGQGRALPTELSRHGWPPRPRTWKLRGQKPGGSAPSPIGRREPRAGLEPASVALQKHRSAIGANGANSGRLQDSNPARLPRTPTVAAPPPFRVLGAIRTRTCQHLGLVPLQLDYQDARAFGRSRTACPSLTRRPLCQVSYEGKWLGKQESNLHKRDRLLIQSQACCRITPFPIGWCGRRESNPHELMLTKV
jgi:hypothetical protein